ncbi:MAG TPA: UBP-type zinc finger domain-containing protein [Candidatus Saccharimonadia bacterium]
MEITTVPEAACSHLDQIKPGIEPEGNTCSDCLREGTKPVQNRLCLTCGHVGCCDSSVGRHARKHHETTGHPIIEPLDIPDGQSKWRWCYIDDTYVS